MKASAPGKVVLSGEYAVLDGAPGIALAINRRAQAVVSEIDGDVSRVCAPGVVKIDGQFRIRTSGIEWLQGEPHFRLVDSVLRSVGITTSNAKIIQLISREFIDAATAGKIGIGASAALTVALTAALKASGDVGAVAQQAHFDLQNGKGSGIDIACSVQGGLIEYRFDGRKVKQLRWPDGLLFRLLWTGVGVSTTQQLALLEATNSKPSRVRLAQSAERLAIVWGGGDANAVLQNYADYIAALEEFSSDHQLGIFAAGHEELTKAASADNLVYKPCGAGGGDVGIVFGTDAGQMDEFIHRNAAKHTPIDCAMDRDGVAIE